MARWQPAAAADAAPCARAATEVLVGDFLNPFRRFAFWTAVRPWLTRRKCAVPWVSSSRQRAPTRARRPQGWWARRRTVQAVLDAMLALLEEVESRCAPLRARFERRAMVPRMRPGRLGLPCGHDAVVSAGGRRARRTRAWRRCCCACGTRAPGGRCRARACGASCRCARPARVLRRSMELRSRAACSGGSRASLHAQQACGRG